MAKEKKANLALLRLAQLNELIKTLENTTVGQLQSEVQTQQETMESLQSEITKMNKKLDVLINLFGVSFDESFTLIDESYSTHTHKVDDTISTGGVE